MATVTFSYLATHDHYLNNFNTIIIVMNRFLLIYLYLITVIPTSLCCRTCCSGKTLLSMVLLKTGLLIDCSECAMPGQSIIGSFLRTARSMLVSIDWFIEDLTQVVISYEIY